MKIEIRNINKHSLSISVSKNSAPKHLRIWEKIIADVLLYGLLNKSTCSVTIDPDKNSVGNEFGKTEKVKYGKRNYLITRTDKFESGDLLEINESSDFKLGLVVVVSSSQIRTTQQDLESLFPTTEDGIMAIDQPVIFCAEDGYCLYWLNFDLKINDVVKKIESIAEFSGVESAVFDSVKI